MKIDVKSIAKVCAIGGALHYGLNLVYDCGKGCMLGAIAKESSEIMDVLQSLSEEEPTQLSKRLKVKIVKSVALYTAKREGR